MTLLEMIEACRTDRLDDVAEGSLWSDPELTRYLNEAQDEACRRARLLVDSSTAEICSIAVSAGKALYALDSRIIFVRRAKLASRSKPLRFVSYLDLDEECPGWEDRTGTVQWVIPDFETGKLRTYRTATAADTMNLTVVRTALEPMTSDGHEPEIPPRFHYSLTAWACHRAFSKPDVDCIDPKRAEGALAEFEREFGPKSPAIDEIYQAMKQPFDGLDGRF
jgi:hypothetical protein